MADGYPDHTIPIGEAYERAVLALAPECRPTDEYLAKFSENEKDTAYDAACDFEWKFCQFFRDVMADADGLLLPKYARPDGKLWIAPDRETWRDLPIGYPNVGSDTHPVVNPGPVGLRGGLFESSAFKEWLRHELAQRHDDGGALICTYTPRRRGRKPVVDWATVQEVFHRKCIENGGRPCEDMGSGWRTLADAERFVAETLTARKESAAESTIRTYASKFVESYTAERGR